MIIAHPTPSPQFQLDLQSCISMFCLDGSQGARAPTWIWGEMRAVVTTGMRRANMFVKGGGCIVSDAWTWTTFRAARMPPKNTIKPDREATFILVSVRIGIL